MLSEHKEKWGASSAWPFPPAKLHCQRPGGPACPGTSEKDFLRRVLHGLCRDIQMLGLGAELLWRCAGW